MVLFLNGPVQNGDFTFRDSPGKAVGIRLASSLNGVLGATGAPHLWNTVTLAGDIRYRTQNRTGSPSRAVFERTRLLEKYGPAPIHAPTVVTDADPGVVTLALAMVEEHLSRGVLRISAESVQGCTDCGHTVGLGATECTGCSSERLRVHKAQLLIKENTCLRGAPTPELLHMRNRKYPSHTGAISRDTPRRLILSRPRSHGVGLDAFGLRGLVLDPRAGLHVTALHAAQRHGADLAAMTVTPNALAHIVAYAHGFTHHNGVRMRYLLHGRIPYEAVSGLRRVYDFHRASEQDRHLFESWFLPLLSLRNKNHTHAGQLPALLKYFLKVRRAGTRSRSGNSEHLREAVTAGDPGWVMDKRALATAMSDDAALDHTELS